MNAPERAVGGVLLLVGGAALAVFFWAARRAISLERALDVSDAVVLGVFAAFASVCVGVGWRLLRAQSAAPAPPAEQAPDAPPSRRIPISQGCAAVGVLLLMLSVLLPAEWHPVVLLFVGLALLAVSHALTPCVERMEQLRKARGSVQL